MRLDLKSRHNKANYTFGVGFRAHFSLIKFVSDIFSRISLTPTLLSGRQPTLLALRRRLLINKNVSYCYNVCASCA